MHNEKTPGHQAPEAVVFTQPAEAATVISISPFEEDHAFLREHFDEAHWRIYGVRKGADGVSLARRKRASVVICEEHMADSSWREVLGWLSEQAETPPLIVTSRLADDILWAEVLNRGGYDVLMKPLDRMEALRVVQLAWRQWRSQREQRHGATVAPASV
jgi:DNA-binding response OmpR family regulator